MVLLEKLTHEVERRVQQLARRGRARHELERADARDLEHLQELVGERAPARQAALDVVDQLVESGLHDVSEHGLLVREHQVEGGARDAHAARDVVHRHLPVAVPKEDLEGGLAHPPPLVVVHGLGRLTEFVQVSI